MNFPPVIRLSCQSLLPLCLCIGALRTVAIISLPPHPPGQGGGSAPLPLPSAGRSFPPVKGNMLPGMVPDIVSHSE